MTLALVITQGVIAAAAVITLIFLLLRGVFSIEKRVANLETKIEPFWEALRQSVAPLLQGLTSPENPISAERWDSLPDHITVQPIDRGRGMGVECCISRAASGSEK